MIKLNHYNAKCDILCALSPCESAGDLVCDNTAMELIMNGKRFVGKTILEKKQYLSRNIFGVYIYMR